MGLCCRSFERFRKYITGRESSLKSTFDRLDADGDGRLTAEEVQSGLTTFGFTCPFSRCVYKTKQQARHLTFCWKAITCQSSSH